ncbi:MAG: glycosyltransferase family 4 protein [Candidatus Pacebacteria bacterium]|jgi:glycosyltransferase involved in cell wall biosynthesis|nr:glycosyltransferase family 4 protein [Candidatus Paceibacterota bacterium]
MSTDTPRTKIAFLITKSNWGGAQKHVYDIATHLDPKKYDVVVILGGHGVLKKKLAEVSIRTISIDTMWRDISVKKDLISFVEVYKILKQEKPDILHLHSPKAAGLGALSARILKIKKIIYTVHGWAFNEDRPLYQKLLIVSASWITTVFATHIVTISKKETDQTALFPYAKNKITLIPNGVREQSAPRENAAREYIGNGLGILLKDKFLVGMIGELHPSKGYEYAVEAMKSLINQHNDILLIIIGTGEKEESLKKLIEKSNLRSHVYLAGFIENASQYAKAFDLFLMSSVKEGLPYTLLEIGLVGIPVIATTVGGIPDIIDDMKSGILIQPRKYQEIDYAVNFMYEHPDMRSEFGRNLIKKVKTDFSLQKMIQSIEKIYSTVAPKTHSS